MVTGPSRAVSVVRHSFPGSAGGSPSLSGCDSPGFGHSRHRRDLPGVLLLEGRGPDYALRRISSTDAKLSTSEASTAFPFSAEARDGRPITPLCVYSPIPVVRRWRLLSATQ